MNTWNSIFCGNGVLLLSAICATLGLQVTIPQSMYEVARGDEVIITCSFQPQNPVNRLIIISWIGEADGSFDDEGITFGTFYSDDGHVDINAMYEGKVQIESDVSKKVSNLILKQVTLRESRRIKCIVQIPGDTEGRTSDSTSLVVLVAPSNPVCKIKGTAEYGQNISLSCVSEEGSPTPTYQWQSYDVKNIPRSFPPKTTEKDGLLSLFNVSMDTSGYYICTSTNKINSAKCNLTLSVMPSTMKIGATAGIIGGCIAGVAVLVLIIYCACKDKPKPEEFAMEPPMVKYHGIPAEEKKGDERKTSIEGHIDQRERYKMKAEKDTDRDSNHRFDDDDQPPEMHDDHRENYSRDYNEDRRDYYDDRKHQYNDQHNNYDDRRGQYDDRQYRSDGRGHYRQNRYDDRNSFDDRREVYDDRQARYDNHRYRYADREDHYNDHRERYERQGQYTDCDER